MADHHTNSKSRLESERSGQNDFFEMELAALALRCFATLLFYVVVVLIIMKCANMAYEFTYPIFGDVAVEHAPGKNVEITVTKGESLENLIEELDNQNLILDRNSFALCCKLFLNEKNQILPGTYELNTSKNYQELLEILTAE